MSSTTKKNPCMYGHLTYGKVGTAKQWREDNLFKCGWVTGYVVKK